MKRHNQKRGFTVVELVVIIAVVAILAAVLIPTYVHLVKKSNEANAQIEDKTLISEMLTEFLLGDKDSADLLVFSKKGDGVYLLGYCAEQQKFLTYRNNPIALTTDMETTVQAAVGKLLAEGVIKQNPDVDNEKNPNDWRLEKNVKTIVGNLNSKYDVVVYANYLINDDLFAAHVHTWETAWTFDGTHHWHKCIGCDEVSGKAEHVYDADGKCVCGAVKATPAHTHLFDKKNVADKYLKSAANCTNRAVYYFSCACGKVGELTFEDGTALGHNFGAGNVTNQPTCTSQGIMTYTCTRDGCNAKNTVSVPALGHTYGANGKCIRCGAAKPTQGHTHKYSEVLKKAATCTTPAEYQLVCSCGEIGSQTYTKGTALGHAWDAGKVTKPATCTAAGVKTFTCTRCNTTRTETIAKTSEHTWDAGVITKPATCKDTGVKTFTCTTCKTTKTETIAKTEHTWNAGEVTTKPTYVSEGKIKYTCTFCGETKVEVLDKKQAIIASEEDFKKAFEEAMNEEAKTLRVKLTSDLNLAKTNCLPPDEYIQNHLPFGSATLEMDLNGHTLYCENDSSYLFLYLVKDSKLVLKNGIVDGFPFEIEANAEVYLENITLKNAGFVLDLAGYEAGENGEIPESNPPAILELNNCKAIYGEKEFDITKDNFGKECCDIDYEFRARIFVNGEKATVKGNTFEY